MSGAPRSGACLLRKRGIKGFASALLSPGCCFEALVRAVLCLQCWQPLHSLMEAVTTLPVRCVTAAVCSSAFSLLHSLRGGQRSLALRGDRCGAVRCSCAARACSAWRATRALRDWEAGRASGL